jgi:hypothetical protein
MLWLTMTIVMRCSSAYISPSSSSVEIRVERGAGLVHQEDIRVDGDGRSGAAGHWKVPSPDLSSLTLTSPHRATSVSASSTWTSISHSGTCCLARRRPYAMSPYY